ncbi:hypothetical protein IGI84_001200 [Enterococcus sp. DIV0008]|uniref:hypothetical protein n=1 Tax=unclassified Enterococcus TaxID=2608891 RepID=UPI003D301356
MNRLLKRLKEERIQGSSAVLNYSNFDYWVNWDDIVDIVEDHDQPQLNENQQIVLEWLKSTWIDRKKNCWFPFEVINSLYYQFDSVWGNHDFKEVEQIEKEKPYIKAYGELTALEQFEVLEKFSRWALVKEEEK